MVGGRKLVVVMHVVVGWWILILPPSRNPEQKSVSVSIGDGPSEA